MAERVILLVPIKIRKTKNFNLIGGELEQKARVFINEIASIENPRIWVDFRLGNHPVKALIDTGATLSVMHVNVFHSLDVQCRSRLMHCNVILCNVNNKEIKTQGISKIYMVNLAN